MCKKERVPADRCPQKQIRKEYLERWVLQILEKEILSVTALDSFAEKMITSFNSIVSESKNKTAELNVAYAMAERKLNNLYKIIENGVADEYDINRINSVKEELNDIKKELKELQGATTIPVLTKEEITNTIQAFHNAAFVNNDIKAKKILIDLFVEKVSINNSEILLVLSSKNVSARMVPKAGLEPARA